MKAKMRGYVTSLMATAMVMMSVPVMYCSSNGKEIFSAGQNLAENLYKQIVGISTPIAIVSIAACLIFSMFSHNEKNVNASRGAAKAVAVSWCILNALVWIFNTVTPYLNGGADLNNLAK